MPRKATALTSAAKRKIKALRTTGATADSITKKLAAMGVVVSESTVLRFLRELPGAATTVTSASATLRAEYAEAVSKEPTSPPDSTDDGDLPKPDEIPEGADLKQINRWLVKTEKLGILAYAKGDLDGVSKMGRLTSMLLERKRRVTPLEKEDPKDNPDMAKVVAEARAKFHRYIDQTLGKS